MAKTTINNVSVVGLACAVPTTKIETSSYVGKFDEAEIKKFVDMVGVNERYVSVPKQTGSDLCYVAAKELMEKKNISPDSIDAIIYVCQIPDYKQPSTAFALHKRLELKQDCIAFDINLGCTGFINGMTVMASLMNAGLVKRGLLVVGEVSRADKESNDHTNAMMFGDAGCACIMDAGDGCINSILKADGNGFNIMGIPGGQARYPLDKQNPNWKSIEPHMDGFETFRFAITKAPAVWKEFKKEYNCDVEDFDYIVFHQANRFMVDHIAHKMKLDKDKYPISIDRYGNTNGVSIPITIVDLCERENNLPDEIRFLGIAFGVGLSWGCTSFNIKREDILPMIHSDDYYEEAYSMIFGKGDENE